MAEADKMTPEVEKKEDAKPVAAEDDTKQDGDKDKKGKRSKGEGKSRTRTGSGPTAFNGYRLNVKNLSDETKDADQLKALFAAHGALTDAQVKTREDGSSRGIGFVVYEKEEDAKKAIEALHDKEIGGKKLDVKPAERRPDEGQDWGKGKGKGKAMMQQYMAMQQAYWSAFAQYGSASQGEQKPGEESIMPGSYVGVLKHKLRYGTRTSYIMCAETQQQLQCDVHIERTDIPEGIKEGDKIKFTVATMYKPWTWDKQQQTYLQLPARGYPKAHTAVKA
jgi:hypothetical protein